MGVRGVGVTDQASGAGVADVRSRERSVDGGTYAEQYVIPISERVRSHQGIGSTFRIAGLASANHNLFAIFNADASLLVAMKHLSLVVEDTGALTSVAPLWAVSRLASVPSGGTSVKVANDTGNAASDADVTIRGAASADGTASAITATLGTRMWSGFKMRQATAVGQLVYPEMPCLPPGAWDDPVILRQNEGLLLQMVGASVTTASYFVNYVWEEYTLP